MSKKNLSHIDNNGLPGMVDVSGKSISIREAQASGKIILGEAVMQVLKDQGYSTKKGSIVQTAILAATMAVKNTFNTIPLCHQIPITSCKIFIKPYDSGYEIKCKVKTNGQTGIEMEALHGVSVAGLTIYDMCKALSQEMVITEIQLDIKTGGKNDYKR